MMQVDLITIKALHDPNRLETIGACCLPIRIALQCEYCAGLPKVASTSGELQSVVVQASDNTDESDTTCIICYDGEATCVLLECGHSGLCKKCAQRLWLRPPNECPSCRAPIKMVLEIQHTPEIGAETLVVL